MEEFKPISKIEVQILMSDYHLSRIVYRDGKLKYKDRWNIETEFPDDCDPIRRLELFLNSEEPQCHNSGCRYKLYRVYPPKYRFDNIFQDSSAKGQMVKAIIYILLFGVLPAVLVWLLFLLF